MPVPTLIDSANGIRPARHLHVEGEEAPRPGAAALTTKAAPWGPGVRAHLQGARRSRRPNVRNDRPPGSARFGSQSTIRAVQHASSATPALGWEGQADELAGQGVCTVMHFSPPKIEDHLMATDGSATARRGWPGRGAARLSLRSLLCPQPQARHAQDTTRMGQRGVPP